MFTAYKTIGNTMMNYAVPIFQWIQTGKQEVTFRYRHFTADRGNKHHRELQRQKGKQRPCENQRLYPRCLSTMWELNNLHIFLPTTTKNVHLIVPMMAKDRQFSLIDATTTTFLKTR